MEVILNSLQPVPHLQAVTSFFGISNKSHNLFETTHSFSGVYCTVFPANSYPFQLQ